MRFLIQSLQELKPHYKILKYDSENNSSQNLEELINKNKIIQIKIYDKIQKKSKYLQIYLLKASGPHSIDSLKQNIQRIQSICKTSFVLQPLDSYLLDSHKNFSLLSDNIDVFVIEFEMVDMTVQEYLSTFEVDKNQLLRLINFQIDFYSRISQLKINSWNMVPFEHTFVQIDDLGKVRLKINYVPNSNCIDIYPISQEYLKRQQTHSKNCNNKDSKISQERKPSEQNTNLSSINNSDDQKLTLSEDERNYIFGEGESDYKENQNNKIEITQALSEQKRNALQKYSQYLKTINFSEQVNKELNFMVNKEEMTEYLVSMQPNAYLLHSATIFQIIRDHPKYKNFEILEMDNYRFEFKIIKSNDTICYLEGKKLNSLTVAEQLEKQYKQLIDDQLCTVTNCELILTEREQYILLERNNKIQYQINDSQNLSKFLLNQIKEKPDTIQRSLIHFLSEFIVFCNILSTKHQIFITTINPSKLLVQREAKEETSRIQFQIEDFNQGDFCYQYVELFEKSFKYFFKYITANHLKQILLEYFEKTSEMKVDQSEQITQQISELVRKSFQIIDLEKKAFENNCQIQLQFADAQQNSLNVSVLGFRFCSKAILFFQQALSAFTIHQISFHYFLDYENILNYSQKPKQEIHQLRQQYDNQEYRQSQDNVFTQFFSQQNSQQLIQFQYELNNLVIKYHKKLLVIEENYLLQYENMNFWNEKIDNSYLEIAEKFCKNSKCLKLSFLKVEMNTTEENPTVIRIFLMKSKMLMILSESPLIVDIKDIYSSFERYFQFATWYQIASLHFPIKNLSSQKLYNDISYIQLLLVSNFKNLKAFDLNLDQKRYNQNYEIYHNLLINNHSEIRSLNINLDLNIDKYRVSYILFDSQSRLNQIYSLNQIMTKLKTYINKLRNLTTLKFQTKNPYIFECKEYNKFKQQPRLTQLNISTEYKQLFS